MAYIISRNNSLYVVAYDGVDPATGRERRRWHAAGASLADAEAIASSITQTNRVPIPRGRDAVTLGGYLTNTWLPERQRRVRATTAYRYGWMIERYIAPTVGQYALRSLRTEHLNDLYTAPGWPAASRQRSWPASSPGTTTRLRSTTKNVSSPGVTS